MWRNVVCYTFWGNVTWFLTCRHSNRRLKFIIDFIFMGLCTITMPLIWVPIIAYNTLIIYILWLFQGSHLQPWASTRKLRRRIAMSLNLQCCEYLYFWNSSCSHNKVWTCNFYLPKLKHRMCTWLPMPIVKKKIIALKGQYYLHKSNARKISLHN